MVTWADAADAAAASSARTAELSRPTAIDPSERLQIFAHVHLLGERPGLHREVDELLVVRLVLGRDVLGHEVPDHWNRIDDIVGGEGVLDQVLACFLRIGVDEFDRLAPGRGEALSDIRPALDEVAGEGAAADERVGIGIAQHVMGYDARLDGGGDTHLTHGGGIGLQRIAGIEGAGLHDTLTCWPMSSWSIV